MAYNNAIPAAPNLLSVDQPAIQNNFAEIQTLINVNHVDFDTTDSGKHKWVTLPSQGAIPPSGASFSSTEVGLYNAVSPATTKQELYINKTSNATAVQIPSTASILSVAYNPAGPTPSSGSAGWSYLPSGLIIIWGTKASANGSTTITLATEVPSAPALTQILNVMVCPWSMSGTDVDSAVRASGYDASNPALFFTAYVSARTTFGAATGGFQWIVIGY